MPTCTNCDSIHRKPAAGSPPPEPPQCSASSRALGPLLQRADLNVVERCCGRATLPEFHGIWENKSEAGFQQTRLGGELNIPVYTSLKSVQAQYRYISFLCLGCIAHQFWNFHCQPWAPSRTGSSRPFWYHACSRNLGRPLEHHGVQLHVLITDWYPNNGMVYNGVVVKQWLRLVWRIASETVRHIQMFGARIQDLRFVIYLASSVLSLCHLFCCHGVLGQNSWNFQQAARSVDIGETNHFGCLSRLSPFRTPNLSVLVLNIIEQYWADFLDLNIFKPH